jgi:sigma-B regulation protein RsbU (phosphoserine phosphatase)
MDGSALLPPRAPPALPGVTGVEMAGRCVPASGDVGGDWYDVFSLPSGQMCAVVGDVTGHGPGVSAIMGRVRRALRACALVTADPAELLGRLNRMMLRFEPDVTATVLCAVFDHGLGQVRISSAGHLAPVLAFPGRAGQAAGIAADLLLGASERGGRRVRSFVFPPGASLALYTDGLVERRDRDIDEGIAWLCTATTGDSPEAVCTSVMAATADGAWRRDDATLLMLRRESA